MDLSLVKIYFQAESLRAAHKWPPLAHPMAHSRAERGADGAVPPAEHFPRSGNEFLWQWEMFLSRETISHIICAPCSPSQAQSQLWLLHLCVLLCVLSPHPGLKPTSITAVELIRPRRTQVMHLYSSPSPPTLHRSLPEIKIIKGLTPPSHTPISTVWSQCLEMWSYFRLHKWGSRKAAPSLWLSPCWTHGLMTNSERIYKTVCPQSAEKKKTTLFMDYFHTMILKNQGQKERGEHNFSMALLPNTWHKCRDWRPCWWGILLLTLPSLCLSAP